MLYHLGHDLKTHLNHYRIHSDAAELAKVAKILLLIDSGKLEEHRGKKLEEIDFDFLNGMCIYTKEKKESITLIEFDTMNNKMFCFYFYSRR